MFSKQCIKGIFCSLLALLFAAGIFLQVAYAYNAGTKDAKKAKSATVTSPENNFIEAGRSDNALVNARDGDIDVRANLIHAVKGYVTINRNDLQAVKVKVIIQKGDDEYLYAISAGSANLPLQMGDGTYGIFVYKNIEDNMYKKMMEITLNVSGLLDEIVYTNSIQMVDYERYSDVIGEINKLLGKAESAAEKTAIIYGHITNSYRYDDDKAEKLQFTTDYSPDLRNFAAAGKGVCYDFASLLAAALRSNGIPARLVMGYRSDAEKYHAWNEVFLDEKWVTIDATYGASAAKAGRNVGMICDPALYSKTREY